MTGHTEDAIVDLVIITGLLAAHLAGASAADAESLRKVVAGVIESGRREGRDTWAAELIYAELDRRR